MGDDDEKELNPDTVDDVLEVEDWSDDDEESDKLFGDDEDEE